MRILAVLLCVLATDTLSSAIQCYNGSEVVLPNGSNHPQNTAKVEVPCSVEYCAWGKDTWLGVTVTGRSCGILDSCAEGGECKEGSIKVQDPVTGRNVWHRMMACCCKADLCNDAKPNVATKNFTTEEKKLIDEELKKKMEELARTANGQAIDTNTEAPPDGAASIFDM
ncbi:hypothetical protein PMAYCL1PPCAC_05697 [Pristionchus mayeri]|uniref:Activin types I and II receptor domain-containing protein n=1 Tax=Pristionchus mayeri TaxID=1317129 RepID=A0AAN4ZD09_9BILA|nr:hypothetical protein PMAYCL1PPCAC_05697 [Pristionchus mayeri]